MGKITLNAGPSSCHLLTRGFSPLLLPPVAVSVSDVPNQIQDEGRSGRSTLERRLVHPHDYSATRQGAAACCSLRTCDFWPPQQRTKGWHVTNSLFPNVINLLFSNADGRIFCIMSSCFCRVPVIFTTMATPHFRRAVLIFGRAVSVQSKTQQSDRNACIVPAAFRQSNAFQHDSCDCGFPTLMILHAAVIFVGHMHHHCSTKSLKLLCSVLATVLRSNCCAA